MNKNIVEVLKSYNLSDSEIQDMQTMEPSLEVVTFDEFVQNCNVLISLGYPKSDLDFLFLSKPYLFTLSIIELKKELALLTNNGADDIEFVLKH